MAHGPAAYSTNHQDRLADCDLITPTNVEDHKLAGLFRFPFIRTESLDNNKTTLAISPKPSSTT